MSSQPNSISGKLRKFSEVSIISLDALKPAKNLSPGEPYGLAPGVTISVLQSASEGLLEIDAQAALTTQVAGKPASELATVHTGQIIKTIDGPFVMVRHLESFIVPRNASDGRSPEILQAMNLASADAAAKESNIRALPRSGDLSNLLNSNTVRSLGSKPVLVRAAIGALALSMFGWYLLSSRKDDSSLAPLQPKASEGAKSNIIAPLDLPETVLPPQSTPPEVKEALVLKQAKIDTPAPAPATKKTVAAAGPQTTKPKILMNSGNLRMHKEKSKSDVPPGKHAAQLTVKERLAVTEFKLEARYDRSSARAKLKHMAESFPTGSPAQLEILKAYNGL